MRNARVTPPRLSRPLGSCVGAAREAAGFRGWPGEADAARRNARRKFAFLTVMEGYVPIIENHIRNYGLEARAIARPAGAQVGDDV